jgi:hypothetical protein
LQAISKTKRYKCAHCAQPFIKERLAQKVCAADCARLLQAAKREKLCAKISAKNPNVTPQQLSDFAVIEQNKISAKLCAKLTREERKKDRAKLDGMKTKPMLKKQLKTALHGYIRARDYGLPCISCGREIAWGAGKTGGACDAGHYRSVGSAAHLQFVEENINAQCKHCNSTRGLSGNPVGYRLGLIKRIGLARVEALESDNTPRHYTHDELRALTTHYKATLKAVHKTYA